MLLTSPSRMHHPFLALDDVHQADVPPHLRQLPRAEWPPGLIRT
jgi:hypothetical protein